MKKSIGTGTFLYPIPTVVVGTYDQDNKPNMMVASWAGVVNSSEPMISVSLRKATYSHDSIINQRAFTVSIPSKKHIVEMDYVGTKSGEKENKFLNTGLTPVKSQVVTAPYVAEFPLVLECELVKYDVLGLHTIFIGRVKDVKLEEACMTEKGMPDMAMLDPITFAPGEREYYEIGGYLGRANRLWQTSLLNPVMQTAEKQKVLQLVIDYYEHLDAGAPLEAFTKMIDWQAFEMINGDLKVDDLEKYESWYQEISSQYFDRKHIVEKIAITELEDKLYKVEMDMYFRAKTWKPGQAKSRDVEVNGKIEWIVKEASESGQMKLVKYYISE